MKANEFRDLTRAELFNKIQSLKESLFSLKFKLVTGQLENTHLIPKHKRDIARALTVLKETEEREKADA